MRNRGRALAGALVVAWLVAACDRVPHYPAHGIVRDVQPAIGQIVIEHEDIPGLMPAMTMNFEADPDLLAGVRPGQSIEFVVAFDGSSYQVTRIRDGAGPNPGAERAAAPQLGDVASVSDAAPEFALVDQDGGPLTLAALRGTAVVLDFPYTSCPGPCPILTSTLVTLQNLLPADVRARTRFVSITLDPDVDTPERLREYALARGADLASWSFLTGPRADVETVVKRYGIGTLRNPDGTIGHLSVVFLLDPDGRIARRYVGLPQKPEEIAADLARVLRAPSSEAASSAAP